MFDMDTNDVDKTTTIREDETGYFRFDTIIDYVPQNLLNEW
jgi:hypothetical protein